MNSLQIKEPYSEYPLFDLYLVEMALFIGTDTIKDITIRGIYTEHQQGFKEKINYQPVIFISWPKKRETIFFPAS